MSVPARCIAVGVLVFLYWTAAFVVALMDLAGLGEPLPGTWWNNAWLREPGYRLGGPILGFVEVFPGGRYADPFGWRFYLVLFITAIGMGTGAWLLSALVSGWWLRRKRPLPSPVP